MFPEVNRNKNIGEKGVNMNSQVFMQYLTRMSFNQELVCTLSCQDQSAHLRGRLLFTIHHVCAEVCIGIV